MFHYLSPKPGGIKSPLRPNLLKPGRVVQQGSVTLSRVFPCVRVGVRSPGDVIGSYSHQKVEPVSASVD